VQCETVDESNAAVKEEPYTLFAVVVHKHGGLKIWKFTCAIVESNASHFILQRNIPALGEKNCWFIYLFRADLINANVMHSAQRRIMIRRVVCEVLSIRKLHVVSHPARPSLHTLLSRK
jgi:hypothetical protein